MCGIEWIVCWKDKRGLAGNRGNEGFVWILFAGFLLKNQISYFKETEKMNVFAIVARLRCRETVQEIYTCLTYHYKSANAIY